MEVSNVAKAGGGILVTGAVVGSAGYGVYEISNNGNYKNLREKFEKEGKVILKTKSEAGYRHDIGGFASEFAWRWLAEQYKVPKNKNQLFKDLSSLTEKNKTEPDVLQEKCSSVLDDPGFKNETEAITWCTGSSSLLPDFSKGGASVNSSISQGTFTHFQQHLVR